MEGFKWPEVSVGWWKIVQKELSTPFTGFRKDVWVAPEPGDEASDCQLRKGGRVKVKHRAVAVILDLPENSVPRFNPVIVDIVQSLVEAFDCHPLNHEPAEDDCCLQNSAQVDLKLENYQKSDGILIFSMISQGRNQFNKEKP